MNFNTLDEVLDFVAFGQHFHLHFDSPENFDSNDEGKVSKKGPGLKTR